jgi:hypothetical protein
MTVGRLSPPLLQHHGHQRSHALWWLIGAYAVPSFPKETMSIRFIGALLGGAAFAFITATGALAEQRLSIQQALVGSPSKVQVAPVGSLKSAKSNTSDRMGGGGGRASMHEIVISRGRVHPKTGNEKTSAEHLRK